MICVKCNKEAPDAPYCALCGWKQSAKPVTRTKRGNGQGSVYKLPSGKYKAVVIKGYYFDEDGKQHKLTASRVCEKKKDAVAAIAELQQTTTRKRETITFKALYDRWLPTHRAGKGTLNCYKAAFKGFRPLWGLKMEDIDIDDLQECVDECGKGKRTRQNMKAVCGLVYKYGIPRKVVPENLNLAQFLIVEGDAAAARESFTPAQIDQIREAIGTVDYADYIYCMIYLGFRPTEFCELDVTDYDAERGCIIGGSKTEAGTNRTVTISPKIATIIRDLAENKKSGPLFPNKETGNRLNNHSLNKAMCAALEEIGIENPVVTIGGGVQRRKFTPHSCRHTFATLMKRVEAPSKDKQELIGHASEQMLAYYQDVDLTDLKKITNAI